MDVFIDIQSIDDNDDAFRLMKQLHTCYQHLLLSFADRNLQKNQLEDLPKDIFNNNINLIHL